MVNYHRDESYIKNEKLFENIFEKRVNLVSKFITKGKVLEIGSATGVMLKLFKDRGWETLGVEPSGSCKEAKKKKISVVNSTFEKAELRQDYFDLVVLNHVLEHLSDPKVVLKKIYLILKKQGIVFVDVPNFGSLASRLMGKKWPYLLPEEHKHQFTKNKLTNLLNDSGLEVIHWESRSGLFEYANPFKELKRKLTFCYFLIL